MHFPFPCLITVPFRSLAGRLRLGAQSLGAARGAGGSTGAGGGPEKWSSLICIIFNVGIAIVNHLFLMMIYHPFMVIGGMVYYCYTNIKTIFSDHLHKRWVFPPWSMVHVVTALHGCSRPSIAIAWYSSSTWVQRQRHSSSDCEGRTSCMSTTPSFGWVGASFFLFYFPQ